MLERLLNQAGADEVRQLLAAVDDSELAISDFSLHPIGVILGRNGKLSLLDQFTTDLFVHGRVALPRLTGADTLRITAAMKL